MQAVINTLLTHYERRGKGPCLLFVHGWGDGAATFRQMISTLEPNYDCIALDLPGFGKSQAPPESWGLADYTKFIADFLEKLGQKKLYAVVGHSNGGAIALKALASNQLSADKLVLIASAGIRIPGGPRKVALQTVAKTGKFATMVLPKSARKRLRARFYQTIGSDLLVMPQMEATFKRIIKEDIQNEAAKLKLPTLLIYGEEDIDTPPAYGRRFQELINNSRLELISDSGHFVHHDQAGEVSRLLKEFLKK